MREKKTITFRIEYVPKFESKMLHYQAVITVNGKPYAFKSNDRLGATFSWEKNDARKAGIKAAKMVFKNFTSWGYDTELIIPRKKGVSHALNSLVLSGKK